MTQKDLADKLFVSDKTVSKWERGNSMPNVTLLIPIADVLGITVTELLQGEKLKENKTLNSDVVETFAVNSLDLSLRDTIRQRKKNWIFELIQGYDPSQLDPQPDLVIIGNAMTRVEIRALKRCLRKVFFTCQAHSGCTILCCATVGCWLWRGRTVKPPPQVPDGCILRSNRSTASTGGWSAK